MTPSYSPTFFRFFAGYARWYVGRSFHSVRLSRSGLADPEKIAGPMIVFLNHASWWDPMICTLLANRFWPDRQHFAAIDAEALSRYRFFAKLGFFGVRKEPSLGARDFLRASQEIMRQSDAVLWITPQGRFTDPRLRPTRLMPGVAHLARRYPQATLLPLAMEYPFWQERFPEALCRVGQPVTLETAEELDMALQNCQETLAAEAISQDASRFIPVMRGAAGVSIVYDLWRRMRALATGQRFSPEHGESAE